MDDGIGVDTVGFLVPIEVGRVELLSFAVHGVYVSFEDPYLHLLVIIGVVGLHGRLHREQLVKLLEIDAVGELLEGRFGLVIHEPGGCFDAVARDTGIGDEGHHVVGDDRRAFFPGRRLVALFKGRSSASGEKYSECHEDTRYERFIG